MTEYQPDEGLDAPNESALDEQFRKVEESRHVDKRQKWWLFGLFLFTLILAAAVTFLLIQSWQETAQSRQAVANEQVEKQQIAEEAQKALCEAGDTAIYDRELCERLQVVAGEPIQGDPGPQGPQGPRGPQGEQGPRGFLGIPGLAGPVGPTGDLGPSGSDGAQGPQGVPGLAGTDGVNGIDGEPGPIGATGAQGEPGPVGPIGPAGPVGATGNAGPAGPVGPSGPPGGPGPAGPVGATGVSIADVDCIGEGANSTWQITLTDGTILNGGGPCKISNQLIPGVPGLEP